MPSVARALVTVRVPVVAVVVTRTLPRARVAAWVAEAKS